MSGQGATAGLGRGAHVVLVHGIWMHGLAMKMMALYLARRGFRTHALSYDFLRRSPAENADALHAAIVALGVAGPVHLVGHSLGGIVVLHLLNRHPELAVGRAVLLGSPVRGSAVARRLHGNTLLRPLLGRSVERGLLGDVPLPDARVELGIIRGQGSVGLAALIYPLEETGDGVVGDSETLLDQAADRAVVPRSHSAMLFSRRVSELVARFLATGRFG